MIQCGTATSNSYVATIVYDWLSQLSAFILTALIMTIICRKLQSDFARVQPAILTLQTVWVALLGALFASLLSMNTARYHYTFSGAEEHYEAYKLVNPIRGIQTTYYTLAVLGLLIASASMLKALFSAPAYLRKGVRLPYNLSQTPFLTNPSCNRPSQPGSPSLPYLPSATPQLLSAPTSNPHSSSQAHP